MSLFTEDTSQEQCTLPAGSEDLQSTISRCHCISVTVFFISERKDATWVPEGTWHVCTLIKCTGLEEGCGNFIICSVKGQINSSHTFVHNINLINLMSQMHWSLRLKNLLRKVCYGHTQNETYHCSGTSTVPTKMFFYLGSLQTSIVLLVSKIQFNILQTIYFYILRTVTWRLSHNIDCRWRFI